MKNKYKYIIFLMFSLFIIVGCNKTSKNLETISESLVEDNNLITVDIYKDTSLDNKDTSLDNIEVKKNYQEIIEDEKYYSKEDVSLYLHKFGKLPSNYMTKNQAKKLGWDAKDGNLWEVTDKGVIGGDKFSNREGNLPEGEYFEADINYNGGYRGSERIVYTKQGKVIYYTKDHYKNFEVLYE